MRTAVLSILTYISFICISFSQDNFLGINGGISLPVGEFASHDVITNSGYATPGLGEQIDLSISPHNYIGFAGSFQFRQNFINKGRYETDIYDYMQNNEASFPNDKSGLTTKKTNTKMWSSYILMVGPQLTYPYGNIVAGIRALTGISAVVTPNNTNNFVYYDQSRTGKYTITSEVERKYLSVALSFGVFLRYVTKDDYVIMAGADYTNTNVRFTNNFKMKYEESDGSVSNIDYNDPESNIGVSNFYAFFWGWLQVLIRLPLLSKRTRGKRKTNYFLKANMPHARFPALPPSTQCCNPVFMLLMYSSDT